MDNKILAENEEAGEFLYKKNNCIINSLKMIFKSRVFKIAFFSVCSFCFGVVIAGVGISISKAKNEKSGIGGLETETISDYNQIDELETFISPKDSVETAKNSTVQTPALTYETYRVKKGDMIGFIADNFNVTQDTIISVNNIKQSRLIQVGQYLKIPSMPGILYTVKADGETPATIAEKYEINAEKCALVNSITTETALSAGTSVFVPDAELDWTTRQEINGDLFHRPIHVRYWLSSPFGWRDSPFNTGKRTFHGGVDLACSAGTPIYAALDGVVTATGYNDTYGNYVIISHHSGYKTLYGHMSRITCKKGNFVYTNTKIGEVGSTGMSTGPHLHLAVYKNGKSVNPLTLIN